MDREKVLQALEHCDLCSDMPNCPGCAYLSEPNCMEHLKLDIIALLKAQEAQDAVKPIMDIDTWVCGKCGTRVERQSMAGPNVLIAEQLDFCPNCGRKVKWE